MAAQQCLIRFLFASVALADWVGNDIRPYLLPNICPHLTAPSLPGAPQAGEHGHAVEGMVSHHVERLSTLKPLFCRVHFPLLHKRVQVAGYEEINLGIECGEEPPDPWEHFDRVGKERIGQLFDRAEVEPIVVAGEVAELHHHWVLRADVVVQSDAPAAVVERRDCIQVFSDPFKVASLLVDC